eukprot:8687373-Alexandrium_andersonii.AAC.1
MSAGQCGHELAARRLIQDRSVHDACRDDAHVPSGVLPCSPGRTCKLPKRAAWVSVEEHDFKRRRCGGRVRWASWSCFFVPCGDGSGPSAVSASSRLAILDRIAHALTDPEN